MPFSSEELTSTLLARRTLDFADLVDSITEACVSRGFVSLSGMQATARRDGYLRYMKFVDERSGIYAAIGFDCTRWVRLGRSPLWLRFQNSAKIQARRLLAELAYLWPRGDVCLEPDLLGVAIPVLAGVERDRVVEAAVQSLRTTAFRLLERWEPPPT